MPHIRSGKRKTLTLGHLDAISGSASVVPLAIMPNLAILMRCSQNCHKWLLAQRSCAILYVPKRSVLAPDIPNSGGPHELLGSDRNQHIIKSAFPTPYTYVHPSDENSPRFVLQFECN